MINFFGQGKNKPSQTPRQIQERFSPLTDKENPMGNWTLGASIQKITATNFSASSFIVPEGGKFEVNTPAKFTKKITSPDLEITDKITTKNLDIAGDLLVNRITSDLNVVRPSNNSRLILKVDDSSETMTYFQHKTVASRIGTTNPAKPLEISTGSSGASTPIVARQYGDTTWHSIKTELTLLDTNGNTTIPGIMTSAQLNCSRTGVTNVLGENVRNAIRDFIYPIGSYYMSDQSARNPQTLFGGSWQRISGNYLYAEIDSASFNANVAAPRRGGSPKIEVANLPPHTHKVPHTPANRSGWPNGSETTVHPDCNNAENARRSYWRGCNDILHTGPAGSAQDYWPPFHCLYVWRRIG